MRCTCTCGARARLRQLVAPEVTRHEAVPPGLEREQQRVTTLGTDGVEGEVERRELIVGAQHRRHVRRARVGEQVA